MEWQEVSKYLFGAIISMALWLIKGIIKELNERKVNESLIKDKVSENFWNIEDIKKDVIDIKGVQKAHCGRIDNVEGRVETIVTTHNLTCPKSRI